jgi:hypothetical protein
MKIFLPIALVLVFVSAGFAQSHPKVFVAAMEGGFDSFIKSALIDEKVPVIVTLDESQAEYIITGTAAKGDNHWYNTVFTGEKDTEQGSIQLVKVSDKSIAWAGSAGDKSTFGRMWKKGGNQKVAGRLARRMKDEFFKDKK